MRAIADLVDSIITAGISPSPWAICTVTNLTPLTVDFLGEPAEVTSKLDSYTPGLADVVLCARVGPQLVVIGGIG